MTPEQFMTLDVFEKLLRMPTGDGGRKRAAGLKPPWWRDLSHEVALFSHLWKWKRGDRIDHDSGAHPLVHLAWRALAIAYIETYGSVDPLMYSHDDGFVGRLLGLGVADATGEP